ncbi:hypothetical protein M0804_002516 [Polistes exclamans]|nr:hypothetical protein M0804_002516 [Polistes exclamans]
MKNVSKTIEFKRRTIPLGDGYGGGGGGGGGGVVYSELVNSLAARVYPLVCNVCSRLLPKEWNISMGRTTGLRRQTVAESRTIGALVYQKRLKKERRARKRLQEQLDLEIKRRTQLEEALKATGASSEQVRAITENVTTEARTSTEPPEASPVHSQSQQQPSQQQTQQQPLQQQQTAAQQYREAQVPRPSQQPSTPEKPTWGYGLDLIGSQASAFWQNYQESLVQELELERKSRQHQVAERDQVKSPLQGAFSKSTRHSDTF